MKWLQEEKIVRFNFFSSIILLMVLSVLLFTLFFYFERRFHRNELLDIERSFVAKEKEWLKLSVNDHIAHLTARKKLVEQELRDTLKKRVENASHLAHHLYETGISKGLEREEIATRILEALRFNQGRGGHFFITSLAGVSQLCQSDPTREGESITEKSTESRLRAFQQMIDIVTGAGKGFVEYQWPKLGPDRETLYKKISFVTRFEPLDWYIGCGEYIVDFEEQMKNRIISAMNTPGWNSDPANYKCILDLHDINGGEQFATMLVNPNRRDLIGTLIPDSFKDIDGKEFVKEYLLGIRENGEAFVTYRFKMPGSDTSVIRISYLKLWPEWNWIVSQETYLNDFERIIAAKESEVNRTARREIQTFLLLFVIALCCSLTLSFFFSKRLKAIFANYRDTQKKYQQELQRQRDTLECQVEQRTAELEKATRQLVHAEKISAIGRLSASIAHEFNNPLNGIRSVMEGLQLNTSCTPEDSKLVDLAIAECDRVKKLIRQLLEFSSPSPGVKEEVDVNLLIKEVLAMLEKELASCGISLETELDEQLPTLQAVPDQLKQVLLNLITNAKDAMQKKSGTLNIKTEQVGQNFAVYIRDSGEGISPETLPQIFEPFFTTKSAVKGTGLGLSVSYGIIKGHDGEIKVESSPGHGTTFSFYLPIGDTF